MCIFLAVLAWQAKRGNEFDHESKKEHVVCFGILAFAVRVWHNLGFFFFIFKIISKIFKAEVRVGRYMLRYFLLVLEGWCHLSYMVIG